MEKEVRVSSILSPVTHRDEITITLETQGATGQADLNIQAKRIVFSQPGTGPLPQPIQMPLHPLDAIMILMIPALTALRENIDGMRKQAEQEKKLIVPLSNA